MLREVYESDIAVLFEHQLDTVSNWQVAFTHEDPTDENAFNEHISKVLSDETVVMKTIIQDNEVAGYMTKYVLDGAPQIGFVLGREFWGKGIATESLREFLSIISDRPIYARTAFDNEGSMRVLQKLGFARTSEGNYYSHARGVDIVEILWTLN
jgi:RimJ/RimL family protein N-acetyltransferase